MAERNDTFGLLSQYGLDLGSEADVRTQLRNKRIQDAMQMVPQSRDPRQQAFGQLGAALGNAFGEKFRPERTGYGQMPPEIANRLNTVKAVKEQYAAWEKANPDTKIEERQEKYQELLAETAFQHDLPDVGIGVLRELQDRRLSRKQKEAELERIGYANEITRETKKSQIYADNVNNGKAGLLEVYPVNSRDPNASITGFFDPATNSLIVTDKEGKEQRIPSHMWKTTRPQFDPYRGGGAGSGGGTKLTPSEGKYIRDKFEATIGLHRKVANVFSLLDRAELDKAGPIQGKMGKTLSFINSWTGYAEQVATMLSPTDTKPKVEVGEIKKDWRGNPIGAKTYDMASGSDRQEWVAKNTDDITRMLRDKIPGLEIKANYANQLISQLTELAYAQAMLSEGGSTRSLSDMDFKNAVVSIGMNYNTPGALKALLMEKADAANQALADRLTSYSADEQTRLIADEGQARLRTVRAELEAYRVPGPTVPSSGATAGSGTGRKRLSYEEWVKAGRPAQ